MKKVSIRNKKTGEVINNVKSYGNGYIDADGNFYSANQWKYVPEKEL